MRICLLSREYPPETGWGGIGAYTYQIATALKELGQDVEVISLAEDTTIKPLSAQSINQSFDKNIPVHRAPWNDELADLDILLLTTSFSHYTIKTAFALWQEFLKRHKEKPFDVVEVPEHLAGGFMPIVARNVPTVVKLHTPHSKFAKEQMHSFNLSFDNQFISLLERVAMVKADLLCSPSIDIAKYVAEDLGIPLNSIIIARNPVDTKQFSPDGPKASLPQTLNGPKVLFVGRLEERKGINHLIDAVPKVVQAIPSIQFIIVGRDTPYGPNGTSMLQHCQKTLQEKGCSENVLFMPHVDLDQMPAYYRVADICVVPSLYDNAPYTCIEALSCGKPVIGTTSGGVREYISHKQTGLLIEPKDSEALAKAIIRLARNETERKNYGSAARSYVLSTLSKEVIAKQMVTLYEQAIKKYSESKNDNHLYLKDVSSLLPDAREFLKAYDRMIYNYLYQNSWNFRFGHWKRFAQSRPKLFAAQALLKVARPLSRLLPQPQLKNFVAKLEDQVSQRSLKTI